MGTTQYNTIVKKNCTIVLYLRLCEKNYGTTCTTGKHHTGSKFQNIRDNNDNLHETLVEIDKLITNHISRMS